jgi:8-oxo-dGTP pyrophosphatase MutT (NUDIX family)
MEPESRKIFPPLSDDARKSAVLILLYQKNNEWFFPLIRRPLYEGHHSGQMALPGGKWEEHDLSLKETALRETCEEIGICSTEIKILGQLTDLFIPVSNNVVNPFIGFLASEPVFQIDKNEVEAIYPISVDSLSDDTNKRNEPWPFMDKVWQVPFYYLGQQKVWGATAMILSEFETILMEIR